MSWPQKRAALGRLQEGSGLAPLSGSLAGAAPRALPGGAQALPLKHHVLAPLAEGAVGVSFPTVAITWWGPFNCDGPELETERSWCGVWGRRAIEAETGTFLEEQDQS